MAGLCTALRDTLKPKTIERNSYFAVLKLLGSEFIVTAMFGTNELNCGKRHWRIYR